MNSQRNIAPKDYDDLRSLLRDYANKLHSISVDYGDRRFTVLKWNFITIVVTIIASVLLGYYLYFNYGTIFIVPVTFVASLVFVLFFLLASQRNRLSKAQIKSIQYALEKLIRRASQIEEYGIPDSGERLRFELAVSEAESTLSFSRSVVSKFWPIYEQDLEMERIKREVGRAVFGTNIPTKLFAEIAESILDAECLRSKMSLDYVLDSLEYEDIKNQTELVKFSVVSAYELLNLTNQNIAVPINLSFLLPDQKDVRRFEGVESVIINGHPLSAEEIHRSSEAVADFPGMSMFSWRYDLEPHKKVRVEIHYVLIKERSDNEIWISVYPTLETQVRVIVKCRGLQLGAKAFSPHALIESVGSAVHEGIFEWRLDKPLLPYQGLVIWWQPSPDAGTDI